MLGKEEKMRMRTKENENENDDGGSDFLVHLSFIFNIFFYF